MNLTMYDLKNKKKEKQLHNNRQKCKLISEIINNPKWAVSSAVERLPYKQVVTGSNPVPPID
jgi:hypothetical protein